MTRGYHGDAEEDVKNNGEKSALAKDHDFVKQKESDYKHLMKIQKLAEQGDEKSIKLAKQLYKSFCVKYGMEEASSLHVKMDDNKEEGGQISTHGTPTKLKKAILPDGYILIHYMDPDNQTQLQPKMQSKKYLKDNLSGNKSNGIYYSEPRCYVYAVHTSILDRLKEKAKRKGTHMYKIDSKPKELYLDPEQTSNYGRDSIVRDNINKEVACFIPTNTPLKITKLI